MRAIKHTFSLGLSHVGLPARHDPHVSPANDRSAEFCALPGQFLPARRRAENRLRPRENAQQDGNPLELLSSRGRGPDACLAVAKPEIAATYIQKVRICYFI
jgi:hypothetical protein